MAQENTIRKHQPDGGVSIHGISAASVALVAWGMELEQRSRKFEKR
jgi:hypothetical protein